MNGFLDAAELVKLTGAKRRSGQIAFLRARRIRHRINGLGEPVVAWRWLDAGADVIEFPMRPNFEAIRRKA